MAVRNWLGKKNLDWETMKPLPFFMFKRKNVALLSHLSDSVTSRCVWEIIWSWIHMDNPESADFFEGLFKCTIHSIAAYLHTTAFHSQNFICCLLSFFIDSTQCCSTCSYIPPPYSIFHNKTSHELPGHSRTNPPKARHSSIPRSPTTKASSRQRPAHRPRDIFSILRQPHLPLRLVWRDPVASFGRSSIVTIPCGSETAWQ